MFHIEKASFFIIIQENIERDEFALGIHLFSNVKNIYYVAGISI